MNPYLLGLLGIAGVGLLIGSRNGGTASASSTETSKETVFIPTNSYNIDYTMGNKTITTTDNRQIANEDVNNINNAPTKENKTITFSTKTSGFKTPDEKTMPVATFGPQTVNVIEEQNGWFKINSYAGVVWVKPNLYTSGQTLTLTKPTHLYDSWNSKQDTGTLQPQNVVVLYDGGEWKKIQTWLGEKWIRPNV